MMLTATQVIAVELAILIIYFCLKETREVKEEKRVEEIVKSEHKNQEARLPKQERKPRPKPKWTEGRKRKNNQERYHFQYNAHPKGLKTRPKNYPFE